MIRFISNIIRVPKAFSVLIIGIEHFDPFSSCFVTYKYLYNINSCNAISIAMEL